MAPVLKTDVVNSYRGFESLLVRKKIMKSCVKSKLFGSILSDGSFRFLLLPSYFSQQSLNFKNIDNLNHPVWTGKRPKEQTEISTFIGRLHKSTQVK